MSNVNTLIPQKSVVYLRGFFARLRGLLLRKSDDRTYVLYPCHDIHTYGMRCCLDIAFVRKDGYILVVYRAVQPRSRLRCKEAYFTVERFSKQGTWLEKGATFLREEG